MRAPAILVCSLIGLSSVHADPLSSADREALLESLEKLRDNANAKVDARFRLAIAAYKEAMTSEETAIEFYLKCIEKVNFEDQQKKNSDFREWKKKEEDRLKDQGFRLALRYQLRWLILTLMASSEKTKLSDIIPEGQEVVDSIFRDASRLGDQMQTLAQPVTGTIFARAYEIGGVENDKWPQSPVNLDSFYGQIVFPPLRMPSRVDSLRAAWIKRIQQEGIKVEAMGMNGNGGRRNGQPLGPRPAETERFIAETVPQLQWQMEMDLFRAGDEAGAAMRMLAHIEKHLAHKSSREWGEDFRNLLKPKEKPVPTAAADAPAAP